MTITTTLSELNLQEISLNEVAEINGGVPWMGALLGTGLLGALYAVRITSIKKEEKYSKAAEYWDVYIQHPEMLC